MRRKTLLIRVHVNELGFFMSREDAIKKAQNMSHPVRNYMGCPVIRASFGRYITLDDLAKLHDRNAYRYYNICKEALILRPGLINNIQWKIVD